MKTLMLSVAVLGMFIALSSAGRERRMLPDWDLDVEPECSVIVPSELYSTACVEKLAIVCQQQVNTNQSPGPTTKSLSSAGRVRRMLPDWVLDAEPECSVLVPSELYSTSCVETLAIVCQQQVNTNQDGDDDSDQVTAGPTGHSDSNSSSR